MAGIENNNNVEQVELTEKQKINDIQIKLQSNLKQEIMFNDLSHANEQLNQKYSLDLSYDSKNDKYYIISGESNALRIPLSQNEVRGNLSIIVKMLNAEGHAFSRENSLTLRGYNHNRYIYQNDGMMASSNDTSLYELEHYYKMDNDEKRALNNEAEDLFRFVMNVKGISEEDWDYDGVCSTGSTCEVGLTDTGDYGETIKSKLIRETVIYENGEEIK